MAEKRDRQREEGGQEGHDDRGRDKRKVMRGRICPFMVDFYMFCTYVYSIS
jgi:hypothetical protein